MLIGGGLILSWLAFILLYNIVNYLFSIISYYYVLISGSMIAMEYIC